MDSTEGVWDQRFIMNTSGDSSDRSLYSRMYRAFVGVATICGIVIFFVYQITAPIIADNQDRALEAAIYKVLPEVVSKKVFYLDTAGSFVTEELQSNHVIYATYNLNQQLLGFAIPAQGMGYQDNIHLLYGYDPYQQAVVGIQILHSRETPGLGSRIEDDPKFVENFHRLDVRLNKAMNALANAIVLVKPGKKTEAWEIDSISGATISSKAVGNIIQQSASFWLPKIKQHYKEFEFGN